MTKHLVTVRRIKSGAIQAWVDGVLMLEAAAHDQTMMSTVSLNQERYNLWLTVMGDSAAVAIVGTKTPRKLIMYCPKVDHGELFRAIIDTNQGRVDVYNRDIPSDWFPTIELVPAEEA